MKNDVFCLFNKLKEAIDWIVHKYKRKYKRV